MLAKCIKTPINRNLEAQAKQLYDYWFVQFDFPDENGKPYKSSGGEMVWNEKLKREIPKGWEVASIGSILGKIKSTVRLATEEYLSIGLYPIIDQSTDKYFAGFTNKTDAVLDEESVVVFGDHSCAVKYVNFPFVRGADGTQIMKSKNPNISTEYLYFAVKGVKIGKGYARHYSFLKDSLIIVPNEKVAKNFSEIASKIFKKITIHRKSNILLTKQRDELLPLLMNGQVSFKPLVSDERFEYLKERMRELLKQKETEVNCDLSVFRVILKGKLYMKSKIVHSIIEKLGDCFSTHQLDVLQDTINEVLADYDLIVCRSKELRTEKENAELLNLFISAKRIEGCSAKTLKYYENTIRLFLKTISAELRNINTNDIRKYLSDFQARNNSSKVTIDNIRRIFSSFFAWLEDEDYIVKSPVRRIHKIRTETLVKEVISDEDLEILRDNCTEIRDLAIIDFLVSTGVRVGELVKINRADIDFQERQCVVLGKGNKERTVYFNARTKIHLRHYLESRTDNNPALFVTLNSPHTRLSISGVEVRLRELGIKADVCRIHPHKFRRTLATMAIDKGMPIEQVQKLLGHVKIDTTLHYAMVNQNNVKIAHRRFIG